MFSLIAVGPPGAIACVPDRLHCLRETGERLPGGDQFGAEVGGRKRQIGRRSVRGRPLGRAGKKCQVVRLAGVRDGECLGKLSTLAGEAVNVRGAGAADDFTVGVVLFHHDDDMVRRDDLRRGGCRRQDSDEESQAET